MSAGAIEAAPALKPPPIVDASSIDEGSITAEDSVSFYFCKTALGGGTNVAKRRKSQHRGSSLN